MRSKLMIKASLAVLLWLAAIVVAILWLDRPWAMAAHGMGWVRIPLFRDLTHLVDPIAALALLGLAVLGGMALLGIRLGRWGRLLLALCLAVALALLAKTELKYLFGRTWPETWVGGNPSWIRDQVFTFDFLHGGAGWESFPSGHATLMAAPMAVLWRHWPRLIWVWLTPVLLVGVGLLACDYHWVSDLLAGAGLGVLCGVGATGLVYGGALQGGRS